MKNNLRITVFILGVIVFASFFPVQSYMAKNGASQQSVDQVVASLMIAGGLFMVVSLLSFIPWSAFKPSNFRLK